ncbi:MAG: DUF4445 domain-containing protein [Gammaproteobacteria bacterium]|nr:DUF4445 domain-containing protein [Gammaproteobacteria bacterium]MBU1777715.1 DUF4445 domain-containing protein [Gammaproteobacteria bacterium]MBU1969264.1 DUF4445 domain-containing protein [Gammaproteobacteria bacterium]
MNPTAPMLTVRHAQGEAQIPCRAGMKLHELLLSGGFAVQSSCGGNGSCGECQVRVATAAAIPITDVERLRLTAAQLDDGIRLACQLTPTTDTQVTLVRPVMQMAWRALREDEYCKVELADSAQPTAVRFGVAIDLGTTHIRITLCDLTRGVRIAGRTGLNPQASYGSDVLTRLMEAAHSTEIARRIGGVLQQAIAEALAEISMSAAVDLRMVGKVALVGNTAMLSLLAGKNHALLLQPENWTLRIDCQPDDTGLLRDAWGLAHDADIRFVAPLGGFIGSDLLAGLVATRLTERPAGSLLIDFGTNSEMALWDGSMLYVTSSAGGPAFEGSGISCGMPGENGAIFRLQQDGSGFALRVLGDAEPLGVCGSGLVDAVAWLLRNGKLDRVGRFCESERNGFVLHEGAQHIALLRGDIDVLQRAKAAIGGGVEWLCRQAGLPLSALREVYACGAFGHLLDVDNARQIGLLPPVGTQQVRLESNAALAGCEMLLMSAAAESELEWLRGCSRVFNLAEDAEFESLFVNNLYLQPMQISEPDHQPDRG